MDLKPIRTSKNSYDEEEEEAILLSPASRMFHEPNYNIHIVAIMGWKVPLDINSIKAQILGKLLKHPRFSSLQVMNENEEMRWVPMRVNIDDHVIVPQIADNNMDADKLIEEYISNLSTTTIDITKPLWDLHILNVKTSHAEATSILRFHHSLGDGIALMSLLLSCFRKTSDPTSLPTLPVSSSKDKSNSNSNTKNIHSLMWQYLVKFWLFIRLLFNTLVDVLLFIATALFLKDSQSPFTVAKGFNKYSSTHQRFIYRTVSLDDIKFIKNATNATINDVILGITQAALSRYIHRKYDVEDKRDFSLEQMRCRATVLVNLRPALGVQAVAEMIEKNAIVIQGNCFGFVIIPLNIAQLQNPLDYVHKAKISMDRKKRSLECQCTFYVLQLFLKFFGFKVLHFSPLQCERKFSLEGLRCRANVIVNLRPALGVHAIAEMIEKNASVIQGNCFGFVLIPLSIAQSENPLDYVYKAKTSMNRKKHSLESRCTFYASQLFLKFFGYKGAAKLAQRVPFQTTLALSNVIGPREEISCAGHPLAFVAPICSGYPTGIMVHVCSYAKKLTFTIAVDEGIIPDLKQLGDDFIDSFMLIKEAAELVKLGTKVE